jgi:virginiamycin B lyase
MRLHAPGGVILALVLVGANGLVHFEPMSETFAVRAHPSPNANVRQLLGRHGEVWGAMSGQDKLVVARPTG